MFISHILFQYLLLFFLHFVLVIITIWARWESCSKERILSCPPQQLSWNRKGHDVALWRNANQWTTSDFLGSIARAPDNWGKDFRASLGLFLSPQWPPWPHPSHFQFQQKEEEEDTSKTRAFYQKRQAFLRSFQESMHALLAPFWVRTCKPIIFPWLYWSLLHCSDPNIQEDNLKKGNCILAHDSEILFRPLISANFEPMMEQNVWSRRQFNPLIVDSEQRDKELRTRCKLWS